MASGYVVFWSVWKARNGIISMEEKFSLQEVKTSFVTLLWSETKMSIVNRSPPLLAFIDWIRSK